jgi:cytochrome c-type biogenesis protein CcsB
VDQGIAHLSDELRVAATVAYTVAMYLYAVEYAFGRRGRVASASIPVAAPARRGALVGAGAGAPDVSAPAVPTPRTDDGTPAPPPDRGALAGRVAVSVTVLGWLLHVSCLVTRGIAAGRVPWGNMYEFALTACLVAVTLYLALLTRQPVRYLGAFVMLPVVVLMGLAGTVLYTAVAPLVPALNSYWLKIHVTAAVTASGIFLVAFAATALYLVRERYERVTAAGARPRFPTALGVRLPESAVLERATFRTIALGFPIWTFAIMAGAVWAEAAWGRYWGWDPKETWSFIAWLVYAAYLHARSTAGWRGRRATYLALLGWAAMMFNLFAVNIVISGLHSYAGLN